MSTIVDKNKWRKWKKGTFLSSFNDRIYTMLIMSILCPSLHFSPKEMIERKKT